MLPHRFKTRMYIFQKPNLTFNRINNYDLMFVYYIYGALAAIVLALCVQKGVQGFCVHTTWLRIEGVNSKNHNKDEYLIIYINIGTL